MPHHLLRSHRHVPLTLRNEIISYAKSLLVLEDPIVPTEVIPAIEGLYLTEGYECHACKYLCGEISTIQRHCYKQHKWEKASGQSWNKCQLQSWFPKRNYFKVLLPIQHNQQQTPMQVPQTFVDDLIQRLKLREEEETEKLETIMDQELDKTENSPWMERTKWTTTFTGKDMRVLSESIERPLKTDIIMMELWIRTEKVLRSCILIRSL